MIFPFPGLLWILTLILILASISLISTMHLRKTNRPGMFILDTNTTQKRKIIISYIIIDITSLLTYISLMIYVSDNIFYLVCVSIPSFLFIKRLVTSQYQFYVDYFRDAHRNRL